MYRELAVHLTQLPSVEAKINLRSGQPFNYTLDQVADLTVELPAQLNLGRAAQILWHYALRFPEIPSYCQVASYEPQLLATSSAQALIRYLTHEPPPSLELPV